MTTIINRSQCALEIFGTNSGTPVRWILPGPDQKTGKDHQTNSAAFNCIALRGTDGVDVFGVSDWWQVFTDEVYVYDWGTDSVTLHCLPVRPGPAGQPSLPGYELIDDPDSVVTVALDPDLQLAEEAPARSPKDGEINSSDLLFGRFVRTGRHIAVRLRTVLASTVAEMDANTRKGKWKKKIEDVWNAGAAATSGTQFQFECDWSPPMQFLASPVHYSLMIFDSVPFGSWGVRNSMFVWSLDMDDATDSQGNVHADVAFTSAHEFGHFLGLTDGYLRDGELPYLNDLLKGNQDLNGKSIAYPWYAPLLKYGLGNSDRALKRSKNRIADGAALNIMARNAPHLVTQDLTDVIDKTVDRKTSDVPHVTQPLYWRPNMFTLE